MYKTLMLLAAFCIILAITAIVINYRKDIAKHYQKLENIPSKVYRSKFGDIEYILEGAGTTILISHGVTGGIDQGISMSKIYLGDSYQRLHVSRFGYLKSSMPQEPTAKMQAAAYNELLNYLGIEKVFILGNSAGGPSASNFAIDYPDRMNGLILIASAVPGSKASLPPDIVFQSNFIYWLITKIAGNSLLKMFIPSSVTKTLTKQELAKITDDVFAAALPISKRSSGILFDSKVSNPSVDAIPFERVKAPTLIIHALDDPAPPIEGAREIAERIGKSTLVTLGGGHLFLKYEDKIQLEIKKFITENK